MYPAYPASIQAADHRRRRHFQRGGRVRENSRGRVADGSVDGDDLRGAGYCAQYQPRPVADAGTRWMWQHCRGSGHGMNDRTKLWSQAWSLMVAQRRDAIAGLSLTLLSIAASLLLPWPMKFIVDNIFGDKPMPGWLPGDKPVALLVVCLGLLAIHFLRGGLSAWGTTYLVRAGLRMTHDLRCRLYEHLQKLGLVFHDHRAVGDSIYRVTWDTFSIQTLFNSGVIPLVAAIVTR